MAIDSDFLKWIEKANSPAAISRAHDEPAQARLFETSAMAAAPCSPSTSPTAATCVRSLLHGRQPGGYVHELSWDEIVEILDNAVRSSRAGKFRAVLRRRADHEPVFFDAILRPQVGYNSVQAATPNGIEFVQRARNSRRRRSEAGLRMPTCSLTASHDATATARSEPV